MLFIRGWGSARGSHLTPSQNLRVTHADWGWVGAGRAPWPYHRVAGRPGIESGPSSAAGRPRGAGRTQWSGRFRNELIDAVWGDGAPTTVENCIHTYIAGLRRALEPRRGHRAPSRSLVSIDSGYCLRLDPAQLDVAVFSRYLDQAKQARSEGDSESAIRLLDVALGL
jgi:hypothetical protein